MPYIDRDVLMTYENTIRIGTYSHRCIDATIIKEIPTADVQEMTLETAIDYLHKVGWMQEHDRMLTESAQPEERKAPISYKEQLSLDCSFCREHECGDTLYESSDWDSGISFDYIRDIRFCPICGRKLYGGK